MENIILVGTGFMAIDYARVLLDQKRNFQVIGRGQESALRFEIETGVKPNIGGIDEFLDRNPEQRNTFFIIATGTENLMTVLKKVLETGASKVLIEKPAAISIEELLENELFLRPFSDKVFVAYNRRFYSSIIEAKRMIEEDGELQTMHFEFSEWAHKIEPLQKVHGIKENWFFANSTHVIDLAFNIAGMPYEWKTFCKKGNIGWHEKTNFTGAGITEKGVLFSYISNWESPGRWGVELLTNKRRIYLKPLEEISVQKKNSILVEKHIFDNLIDISFKPGLYHQVSCFFSDKNDQLCSIQSHIEKTKHVYKNIISL